MGRTILPYSRVIQWEREKLKKFRRALRKEEREIFDTLFDMAKNYIQAGSYASFDNPMVPIFLSILIEQQREIQKLREELENLKSKIPL